MSSKYLLKENPLVIDKQLAKIIGLNESIVLQQIEYWLNKFKEVDDKRHYHKGKWWVYNSYREWKTNFPFWSESTIRRAIKSLEDKDILITDNFNKLKIDRTKWYSINYEKLDERCNDAIVQNEQVDTPERTDGNSKMNKPLPKNTTKNTQRDNNGHQQSAKAYPYYHKYAKLADDELYSVVEYYNNIYARENNSNLCLKPHQWGNVRKRLEHYLYDLQLTADDIKLVIDKYFADVESDHNILHFISGDIIKHRLVELGLAHYSEVD